jgi:hypothetical protein
LMNDKSRRGKKPPSQCFFPASKGEGCRSGKINVTARPGTTQGYAAR